MTQKERETLLKDLCSRLPYNPLCKVDGVDEPLKLVRIESDSVDGVLLLFDYKINDLPLEVYLSEVKPYLRLKSTMTEEENEEYRKLQDKIAIGWDSYGQPNMYTYVDTIKSIDFLNSHHLDYRGLTGTELALEMPKEIYKLILDIIHQIT